MNVRKFLREKRELLSEADNDHSALLSQMSDADQRERNEYLKFVQDQFDGDFSKGKKAYAEKKNRSPDDIFGDQQRIQKLMNTNFDFSTFSEEDWENYWTLAQHADDYIDFQKEALNAIEEHLGTDNELYKFLFDRIQCKESGNQKFNTQDICEEN